jgi:hypothetical protein
MRYTFGLIFLATGLLAQSALQPRMISGVVVGASGKPVQGARIDHGDSRTDHLTGVEGRFEFVTTTPAVVVRKTGYQSHFMRTEDAVGVRIVLEPAHPFPACTLGAAPKHIVQTGQDNDHTSTATIIETKEGEAAIVCGNGPFWSSGVPGDSFVWESVEYSESVTSDYGGVVDARGKTLDGKYWRYRGILGSSCSYSKVDQTTAAALDCLMSKTPGRLHLV